MKSFNESEIKYLAGLLDADGCLSLCFVDNKLYLEMSLSASESIDKHGYIDSLADRAGSLSIREYPNTNWSTSHQWRVHSRSELNMLLPRLVKHMVIKGRHWKHLFDLYTEHRAKPLSDEEIGNLKDLSSSSRLEAGPIKHKNHPTWAWIAGFLDGDGCYTFKKHSNPEAKNAMSLKIAAVSHLNDRCAIDLLFKAFGGSIRYEQSWIRWSRNLGPKDGSFAISFLRKVHRHSRLKKWKIEQMLAYHNNRLQRLTED